MPTQAQWGSYKWLSMKNRINLLEDPSFSVGYSYEEDETSGNKPTSSRKGPELREMTFNYPVHSVLGMDAEVQYRELVRLSESAVAEYFYLGGLKMGQHKWVLKSVSAGNVTLNHQGWWISAELKLTFTEFIPGTSGATKEEKSSNKRKK